MDRAWQEEVRRRLRGKHHLIPIFQSVYHIPERLYEYDRSMFLVFNTRTQKYEVHCLDHIGDTFAFTVPYDELDVRTLRHVWRNDLRKHGRKIFLDIERSEEAFWSRQEREWREWIRDMAKETRTLFARGAWGSDDSKVVFGPGG